MSFFGKKQHFCYKKGGMVGYIFNLSSMAARSAIIKKFFLTEHFGQIIIKITNRLDIVSLSTRTPETLGLKNVRLTKSDFA